MMPDLDTLIKVIQCDKWFSQCKQCPYGYQYWDDSGDNGLWCCDENRIYKETLFFLKLYNMVIKDNENKRTSAD